MLLESMIPRRMVRADTLALETGVKGFGKVEAKPGQKPKAETAKRYRLYPFLVGWYESYLQETKPETTEFARTYEQYVIEGGGEKIFARDQARRASSPTAGRSSRSGSKREPHNDIDAHFQRHDRFLVIDCVCKKEKVAAHGHSCELPNKRCGFVGMPPAVPLSENVIAPRGGDQALERARRHGDDGRRGVLRLHHGGRGAPVRRRLPLLRLLLHDPERGAAGPPRQRRSSARTTGSSRTTTSVTPAGSASGGASSSPTPSTRPPMRSPSTTGTSASAAAPVAWAARRARSTWSPSPRRSGSTCRRASRSGRSGASSSWQRRSEAWADGRG